MSNFPRPVIVRMLMVIIGVLLLFQYFYNRSLWLDEAMLALNIIEKNPLALLKPLDHSQVAPILFLLIEKLFALVLGNNDLSLRLFPLLCALVSLPLLFDFGSALARNRMIPFLTLCLLACTPKFIYYSSEVKQYESDVFVLCAIYFAAFSESSFAVRNRSVLLTITGAIAVFLSNASVIPLAVVGLLLLYRCIRNKADRPIYAVPLLVWGVCIGINYFAFEYHNPIAPGMRAYWKDYFMPFPSQPGFKDWLGNRAVELFSSLLPTVDLPASIVRFPSSYILSMVLYGGGLIYLLVSKRFRLFYLCTGPVVLHLLLSALKIYPFYSRLILYMVPLFLLVMASGLYALCSFFLTLRFPLWRYLVPALFVLLFTYNAFKDYPFTGSEEIKPVIADMNHHMKDGYNVYVYFGAKPAFQYYEEIGYAHFGGAKIVMGEAHVKDWDGYLREMQSLKGPTWLLMSHGTTQEEEQHILKGMAARGKMLRNVQGWGSRAYLFELK